jgi:hypothetical protein
MVDCEHCCGVGLGGAVERLSAALADDPVYMCDTVPNHCTGQHLCFDRAKMCGVLRYDN